MGWIAALAICTALYLMLHLKVHSVVSEVVRAERQIVALEQEKLLLETEFQTRANQLQLAAWNRVDFGYTAPEAAQFLEDERQLASFGSAPMPGAPAPLRVAVAVAGEEPVFPKMVSPLTGRPVDVAPEQIASDDGNRDVRIPLTGGSTRITLAAITGSAGQ
jgi:hypothetical protein